MALTKTDALVSITQTVLRTRLGIDACLAFDNSDIGTIARAVAEFAPLLGADVSEENAAIIEIMRRWAN